MPGAREWGGEAEARWEEGGKKKKEDEVAGDWLSPVAGAWSLRLLSALLRRRSGRRLRAPSEPIRSQPAPAGEAAIGRSPVTKRDKGRRGKEKKREKKKRKKAQTAVTDRLGKRSGAQAARRQAGLPLKLGPPGRVGDGEDGLARDTSARRLAAGEGREEEGRVLSLGGTRAILVHRRFPVRVLPHRPLPSAGTTLPTLLPHDKLSNKAKVPKQTCWTVTAQ